LEVSQTELKTRIEIQLRCQSARDCDKDITVLDRNMIKVQLYEKNSEE
jgi:hypothetical protein